MCYCTPYSGSQNKCSHLTKKKTRIMPQTEELAVRRIRVSYVGACAHDRLVGIGAPEAYSSLLLAPAPISGLDVSLPFDASASSPQSDPNWVFWSKVSETTGLKAPRTIEQARKLSRAAIPLRHRAPFNESRHLPAPTAGSDALWSLKQGLARASLELHLLPFGLATLVTADVYSPTGTTIDTALGLLDDLEGWPFRLGIGSQEVETTVSESASRALELGTELVGHPEGNIWRLPTHRVVTIIDASQGELPPEMPLPSSKWHEAVHRLANGGLNVASPDAAFVPRWTGTGFNWSPADWVYMLDRGSSIVVAPAALTMPTNKLATTSSRHRRMALLIAHVTACAALVSAASGSESPYFPEWARTAALRLGRLYGPSPAADDYWGMETRHLLKVLGLTSDIPVVSGQPLKEKFPEPVAYPGSLP
jgi:hypothetical protein